LDKKKVVRVVQLIPTDRSNRYGILDDLMIFEQSRDYFFIPDEASDRQLLEEELKLNHSLTKYYDINLGKYLWAVWSKYTDWDQDIQSE